MFLEGLVHVQHKVVVVHTLHPLGHIAGKRRGKHVHEHCFP